MSGIGYDAKSSQYLDEPHVGPAREASVPTPTIGYKWEGGTLIPPPSEAPGARTVGQILDARTPPRSHESFESERLRTAIMMTYSREFILKRRIEELEQAMAHLVEPKS